MTSRREQLSLLQLFVGRTPGWAGDCVGQRISYCDLANLGLEMDRQTAVRLLELQADPEAWQYCSRVSIIEIDRAGGFTFQAAVTLDADSAVEAVQGVHSDREDGFVMNRAKVWDASAPQLVAVWERSGAVILEGCESCSPTDVGRLAPKLLKLLTETRLGRKPEPADERRRRRRGQAQQLWAERGAGKTVAEAAKEVGVSVAEANRILGEFGSL